MGEQRRQWQPTPELLPGKSHGHRSLVGCRLWGRTELDTTEATQQQQQQYGRERRMELEESTCLTSNYTTKLVIKIVWYWHKDKNIDQWNKVKNQR